MPLVDPAAVEAIIGGAAGLKVFGPSLDIVGRRLEQMTEAGASNVGRVLQNAARKVDPNAPRSIPNARVLKAVIEESEVAEDSMLVEYLGGVLASARSGVGRDDRAAVVAAQIGRLSSYQLRLHYMLCSAARSALHRHALLAGNEIHTMQGIPLFLSAGALKSCFGLHDQELQEYDGILSHALHGLSAESLVHFRVMADRAELARNFQRLDVRADGGLLFSMTAAGVILFVAAHGLPGQAERVFMAPDVALPVIAGVAVPHVDLAWDLAISHDQPFSDGPEDTA